MWAAKVAIITTMNILNQAKNMLILNQVNAHRVVLSSLGSLTGVVETSLLPVLTGTLMTSFAQKAELSLLPLRAQGQHSRENNIHDVDASKRHKTGCPLTLRLLRVNIAIKKYSHDKKALYYCK